MAIFGHYLPIEGREKLKNYKYTGGSFTPIDSVLNHWWNFVVQLVPMRLAPNVITLAGFLCTVAAFLLVSFYSPSFTEAVPRWVCFAYSGLLFAYQTLDAIDGKQARRTNSSSPLGTLFDHGCDIVSSTFVSLGVSGICMTGTGGLHFTVIIGFTQLSQYLYMWWEHHFNVFNHNPGYAAGVTEAQLLVIALGLVSGVFGPENLWTFDLLQNKTGFFGLANALRRIIGYQTLSGSQVVLIILAIVETANTASVVRLAMQQLRTERRSRALRQLIAFGVFLIAEYQVYVTALGAGLPTLLLNLVCAIGYSLWGIRILLASTSDRVFHSIQWPLLPFFGVAVLFAIDAYLSAFLSRGAKSFALWVLLAWQSFYGWDLLSVALDDICETLNIRCFVLGRRTTSDASPSVQERQAKSTSYRSPAAAQQQVKYAP